MNYNQYRYNYVLNEYGYANTGTSIYTFSGPDQLVYINSNNLPFNKINLKKKYNFYCESWYPNNDIIIEKGNGNVANLPPGIYNIILSVNGFIDVPSTPPTPTPTPSLVPVTFSVTYTLGTVTNTFYFTQLAGFSFNCDFIITNNDILAPLQISISYQQAVVNSAAQSVSLINLVFFINKL